MSDTNVRKGSRVRNIPEWLKADEYDKIIDRIHVPTTEPRMKRKLTGETCDYSQVKGVVDELSETFANLKVKDKAALLDELDDLSGTFADLGINKRRKMNGGGISISGTGLILYLIKDAMEVGIKEVKDASFDILSKGLIILEQTANLVSNNNGCAEQFLYQLLGDRLMAFFKFYLLGVFSQEAIQQNPLIILNKLLELFIFLVNHSQHGIGITLTTTCGYLIYHYSSYYGKTLKDNADTSLNSISNILTEISEADSEKVVENVNSKAMELTKKLKAYNESINKESATHKDLMRKIGLGLTGQHLKDIEYKIKDITSVMTQEQLKTKLEELDDLPEPEQVPVPETVPETVPVSVFDGLTGGKRKGKRKTKKNASKKSNKLKKNARKSRKVKK